MIRQLLLAASLGFFASAPSYSAEAILAGGCFWCIEKDFENVEGVTAVMSGYTGGTNTNPTYKNHTKFGHREAVRVVFDEGRISYRQLLDIFWRTVDPTDAGGQFCDRGLSYTTAVYVSGADQKEVAQASRAAAEKSLGQKIVTEILPVAAFTPSEDYHQDYARKNPIRYNFYRRSCGRDRTVKKLWGKQAYTGVAGR